MTQAQSYTGVKAARERDRRVEFVNSDPRLVSIFMCFLRNKDIDESRLKARMMIHTQDDETECGSYWKRFALLDDYKLISTIVKKPSIAKTLTLGTVAIRLTLSAFCAKSRAMFQN